MIRPLLIALVFLAGVVGCRNLASPGPDSPSVLTVYSTTDLAVFAPIIAAFERQEPGIEVNYVELDSAELYRRYRAEVAAGEPSADLLLSSAMDLQVKLVNDGYARKHQSRNARAIPPWARWREEAFGFTFEPAVIVLNASAFADRPVPQTRQALLEALRADPPFWKGRIGMYDIGRSSAGYLLAAQDARHTPIFGAMLEEFGRAEAVTDVRSRALLDRIASGELVAGYNVLASYARPLIDAGEPIRIVYPADYTLAVLRTAFISKAARNPRAAHLFLDYLLSVPGQKLLATRTGLSSIREDVDSGLSRLGLAESDIGVIRPIPLGPALLVYLDQRKRRQLLQSWSASVRENADQGS